MNQTVDAFSARLAKEMSALDQSARSELLLRVGRMELKMRALGQDKAVWKGPLPETKILGKDVVVQTEFGERRGRVVSFGIVQPGAEFERSVVVHVAASGTNHEVAGSEVKIATADDVERMKLELIMANKLKGLEAEQIEKKENSAKQKKKAEKDPVLVNEMLQLAKNSKNVESIDEGGANYKISKTDGCKVYLFKTQLRVDLSGFCVKHSAVREISESEARDMHLGKVRGQLIFDDKKQALDAFSKCI